jgi:hypothetical protein
MVRNQRQVERVILLCCAICFVGCDAASEESPPVASDVGIYTPPAGIVKYRLTYSPLGDEKDIDLTIEADSELGSLISATRNAVNERTAHRPDFETRELRTEPDLFISAIKVDGSSDRELKIGYAVRERLVLSRRGYYFADRELHDRILKIVSKARSN